MAMISEEGERTMRFKTSGIAPVLLLSLIAGALMMALGPALAGQAYHHPYYQNPFYFNRNHWVHGHPYYYYHGGWYPYYYLHGGWYPHNANWFRAHNYYYSSNWHKFYHHANWAYGH